MRTTRFLLLSMLFCLLFNEPIISIVNRSSMVMGVPVLYAYVLTTWALLIGVLIYVINRYPPTDDSLPADE